MTTRTDRYARVLLRGVQPTPPTPAQVVAAAEKRIRSTMAAEGGITDNVIGHFRLWETIYQQAVARTHEEA